MSACCLRDELPDQYVGRKKYLWGNVTMERIVLAPGISESELLRTLAAHGVGTMGLRVMGAAELARTALMRSGIFTTGEFLPRNKEAALIDTFIRQTSYFSSASFADSENMASALFSLRSLIPENEADVIHARFAEGEFPEKNKAIAECYDKFMAALRERGLFDTIGLIRKAIAESRPVDAEILVLNEFPLSPLEKALCGHVSGKKYRSVPATELFGTAEKQDIRNIKYLESYGAANEVEDILATIADNGIPYDRCTVVVTEPARYAQLFFEYSKMYGVEMTFGCGLPIVNSYPVRLLLALDKWDNEGFHGVDALNAIVGSEATDKNKLMETIGLTARKDLTAAATILGNLKCDRDYAKTEERINVLKTTLEKQMADLGKNPEDRDYKAICEKFRLIEPARKLGRELGRGYAEFIADYAYIRPMPAGRLDIAARDAICDAIETYTGFSVKDDIKELIPELMNRTVCSEAAREGALHIVGLSKAFGAVRDHLFVTGLSAGNFPGNPSENYLLLDSDLEMFGEDTPTSVNRIIVKKQMLLSLVKLACSLDVRVQLSFSDYNAAQMSTANPSSVLFEIYKEEHGEDAKVDDFRRSFWKTGYFCSGISRADEVGLAYNEGKELQFTEEQPEAEPFSVKLSEYGYSPSTLDNFFSCPYSFMLENVIGIKDDEETDPFSIVNAMQFGTLAHSVMKWMAVQPSLPSKEEFIAKAGCVFDDFLKEYVPLNEAKAQRERKGFLDVVGNLYDIDPKNKVVSAEEWCEGEHETGIKLHGYPDRVEKDKDGNYLIADFKTGNNLKHKKDDIDSCLQVVAYAYMLEKQGIPINYGQYLYPKKHKIISCVYNDDMKQKLYEKLDSFKQAMEAGEFPTNPGKSNENCKYCKYVDICAKGEVKA